MCQKESKESTKVLVVWRPYKSQALTRFSGVAAQEPAVSGHLRDK